MNKSAQSVEQQLRSIADFSSATEHIIAHGDRISALEANMQHLPTTEYVRNLIELQTTQMNGKFTLIDDKLSDINSQRQRWLGIAQAFIWIIPTVIAIVALLR